MRSPMNGPTKDLDDREIAITLADLARPIALRYFRQPSLIAESKLAQSFDPVTAADREIEAEMRAFLSRHRPGDGIMGEEEGEALGRTGRRWILDPIDGTRAFLSGAPSWGVLIALEDEKGIALGVIDQPFTGERFMGSRGRGAQLIHHSELRHLHTRQTSDLEQAILFSTFPEIGSLQERRAFERVSQCVRLTRFGMDCYAYALLAAGHIDLVIEAGLNLYDIAAPIAVIEAAGGVVSNWHGGPAGAGGQIIAAANHELHAAACKLLSLPDSV